jgi:hypothetical protein
MQLRASLHTRQTHHPTKYENETISQESKLYTFGLHFLSSSSAA